MIIAVLKESKDSRVALIPDAAKKLLAIEGVQVLVESGVSKDWDDASYVAAGAKVEADRGKMLEEADLIFRINPSSEEDLARMKRGATHISLLDPYNNQGLVETYAEKGINAISLEMIPRITIAQKMDVLSSQASLAGYVAVIKAAERLNKILPMMMTAAGTLSAAQVFVIGAGVAGLQAIATAKRLGARVEAFDTRPVVEEQVLSLGGKFLKVDLGETGQTKEGYALKLTEEQLAKQREAMGKAVAKADITITTAKLFGRKAPVLISAEMLKNVKPGAIIVDLAAGSGGNVEGVKVDEEIVQDGVRIIGIDNLPGEVSLHASQMFASNIVNLVTHLWDAESKTLNLGAADDSDKIAAASVIVRDGGIVHQGILDHYKK